MAIFGRYDDDLVIDRGNKLGTARIVSQIRVGIRNGTLPIVQELIATDNDRLDTIAAQVYGDAKLWWVLAAASGIGWGLQVPPGTVVSVINLNSVEEISL